MLCIDPEGDEDKESSESVMNALKGRIPVPLRELTAIGSGERLFMLTLLFMLMADAKGKVLCQLTGID